MGPPQLCLLIFKTRPNVSIIGPKISIDTNQVDLHVQAYVYVVVSNFWIELKARVQISFKNGPKRDFHFRIQVGIMLESTLFQILK